MLSNCHLMLAQFTGFYVLISYNEYSISLEAFGPNRRHKAYHQRNVKVGRAKQSCTYTGICLVEYAKLLIIHFPFCFIFHSFCSIFHMQCFIFYLSNPHFILFSFHLFCSISHMQCFIFHSSNPRFIYSLSFDSKHSAKESRKHWYSLQSSIPTRSMDSQSSVQSLPKSTETNTFSEGLLCQIWQWEKVRRSLFANPCHLLPVHTSTSSSAPYIHTPKCKSVFQRLAKWMYNVLAEWNFVFFLTAQLNSFDTFKLIHFAFFCCFPPSSRNMLELEKWTFGRTIKNLPDLFSIFGMNVLL